MLPREPHGGVAKHRGVNGSQGPSPWPQAGDSSYATHTHRLGALRGFLGAGVKAPGSNHREPNVFPCLYKTAHFSSRWTRGTPPEYAARANSARNRLIVFRFIVRLLDLILSVTCGGLLCTPFFELESGPFYFGEV